MPYSIISDIIDKLIIIFCAAKIDYSVLFKIEKKENFGMMLVALNSKVWFTIRMLTAQTTFSYKILLIDQTKCFLCLWISMRCIVRSFALGYFRINIVGYTLHKTEIGIFLAFCSNFLFALITFWRSFFSFEFNAIQIHIQCISYSIHYKHYDKIYLHKNI